MSILIRRATQQDIPFCSELEQSCFSEPWSERSFAQSLLDDSVYFYVAEEAGKLVGYYVAGNICDEVNLYTIAVASSARGQGIGDALLKHLVELSKEQNALFVGLEVRVSNKKAISLYEKHSFILSGKRPNFYKKPNEDALLYTLYMNEEKK